MPSPLEPSASSSAFCCPPRGHVASSVCSCRARRVLHQPLPVGFAAEPFALDGGPFGAFARSRALSDDRRIVAVATPGHTPGHISVICIDDFGRHVMLAGDATDSLEQLHARRAHAVGPDPKVHVATLDTILAHCAEHPTVYLPSHDPESLARFTAATTVDLDGAGQPSGAGDLLAR
jgi:N-acyl homoserine lactone hydrolase